MATARARTRSDGTTAWQVRWRDPDTGVQRSATHPDRGEATRFAQILTDCGHRLGRAEQVWDEVHTAAPTRTVAMLAALHIDEHCNGSQLTRAQYTQIVADHITPTLGAIPAAALTRRHIRDWVTSQAQTASQKSLHNRHGLLSAILSTGVAEHWISENVAAGTPLPRRAEAATEIAFLTTAQYGVLLGEMTDRYKPLVEILARTGMRWGEATALTVGDVRFTDTGGDIRINKAMTQDAHHRPIVGPPKTKKSRRTVSIDTRLAEQLEPLTVGRARTDRLILPKGVRRMAVHSGHFWEMHWNPATVRAADRKQHATDYLTARPRIHDLRHSHASWLIAAGVDPLTVSRRLGHESISITLDLYSHLFDAQQQGAADAIGRALS